MGDGGQCWESGPGRDFSVSFRVSSSCAPSTSALGPVASPLGLCQTSVVSHSGPQKGGLRHSGHFYRDCCIVCVCVCFEWQLLAWERKSVFNSNSCLGLWRVFFWMVGVAVPPTTFTNCHKSNSSVKHWALEGSLLPLGWSSDLREHCDMESELWSETRTKVADAGPAAEDGVCAHLGGGTRGE